MRRLMMSIVLGTFLAGAGCVHEPLNPRSLDEKSVEAKRPSAPPPVTADQITAQNAHAKAQALRDEVAQER